MSTTEPTPGSTPGPTPGPPPGRPGRYQRSFNGLIGAMVILVVVVIGFVVFRGAFRADLETPVRAIDYEPVAAQARQAGLLAPTPEPLPRGWKVTSARFTPLRGDQGSWHLGALTRAQKYVAVAESVRPAADLVTATVDNPQEGARTRIDGRVWTVWTGDENSYALSTRIDDRTVLVGSPAGEGPVRLVVGRLEPLDPPATTQSS